MIPPVSALLRRHRAERPEAPSLVSIDEARALTWRELAEEVDARAAELAQAGLRPGERLAVVAENSLELATLYYAAMACGAVFCPVSAALAQEEIARCLARLAPRLVFRESAPGRLERAAGAAAPAAAVPGHAAICFTSGTTADAKAVAHTYESYYHNAAQTVARWRLAPGERVLDYRSFAWAATHTVSLHPLLLGGHALVFARGFRAGELGAWLRQHRPSILVGIPQVIDALLDSDAVRRADLAGVRFVSCSTAPLSAERHRSFEERFGLPLVQLYGMSEAGLIALNPHDRRRIGSVGLPSGALRLRLLGASGEELAAGEIGEIVVGGDACASHYLAPDGSLAPIARGALPTGDMGRLDADGYLYLLGRTAQAFVRNGRRVLPFLIDEALAAAPPVKETASVGRDGRITSFVVRRDAIDAAGVIAHCGRTLPPGYLPDEVVFCDEIPRNARGKVDYEKLRRP